MEALTYNNTLQSLDLSENSLGPEVGLSFSQMLQLKNMLVNLNLAHNKLGSRGASAIGEAFKVECLIASLIFH